MKPRPSIVDLKDQHRVAKQVHQLVSEVESIAKDISLLWDIVATQLKIAVCDYCHAEWFTISPHNGPGPRGDVRGLLVAGGACCTKCLDRLYEDTACKLTEDEMEECFQDVAMWLNRYPGNTPFSVFGKDSLIIALRKRLAP